MLVRKSGRVQLILGQVTLDVSLGASCSFLQVLLDCKTHQFKCALKLEKSDLLTINKKRVISVTNISAGELIYFKRSFISD